MGARCDAGTRRTRTCPRRTGSGCSRSTWPSCFPRRRRRWGTSLTYIAKSLKPSLVNAQFSHGLKEALGLCTVSDPQTKAQAELLAKQATQAGDEASTTTKEEGGDEASLAQGEGKENVGSQKPEEDDEDDDDESDEVGSTTPRGHGCGRPLMGSHDCRSCAGAVQEEEEGLEEGQKEA